MNLAAPASSGAAQLHLPRSLVLSRHTHHSCYLNLYTLDAIPHRARLLMAASESVWAFVAKENGDDGVIVKGAEPPTSAAEHVQARCARVVPLIQMKPDQPKLDLDLYIQNYRGTLPLPIRWPCLEL